MIKAIIFDLGGVYFSKGTRIAILELAKSFPNLSEEQIETIVRGEDFGKMYRLGKIMKADFWKKVEKYVGFHFDVKKFAYIWNSSYTINKDVEKIVLKLRKRYKLGVLSGNIRERIKFLENKYNFKKNFNKLTFSYVLKANKPDEIVYLDILKKLNCKNEECIFIDDSLSKLETAKKWGMKTIHFKGANQLRKELADLGVKVA